MSKKDIEYPYVYADDLIVSIPNLNRNGTKLSRPDAIRMRQKIAEILDIDDDVLAKKFANYYLKHKKEIEQKEEDKHKKLNEAHKSTFLCLVSNPVDNGIFVLIEMINRLGIRTVFSCENLAKSKKIQIMVDCRHFKKFEKIVKNISFKYENCIMGRNYLFRRKDYFKLMKNFLIKFNKLEENSGNLSSL